MGASVGGVLATRIEGVGGTIGVAVIPRDDGVGRGPHDERIKATIEMRTIVKARDTLFILLFLPDMSDVQLFLGRRHILPQFPAIGAKVGFGFHPCAGYGR